MIVHLGLRLLEGRESKIKMTRDKNGGRLTESPSREGKPTQNPSTQLKRTAKRAEVHVGGTLKRATGMMIQGLDDNAKVE